jgi:hypothetical protein
MGSNVQQIVHEAAKINDN